ncbi:hypothetical protein Goarm_012031 [Gossypium armourianum]|uniref:RNase H type-1 domain-containing protein n=1 Tax=Gossypium armourianum TaxID=34283 RepID=A0A7J9IYN0_9ROSI|nr:hypothetical protein [Gossypium armourianum]
MGLDLGLSKVVIEGDNLSVIKKLYAQVIDRSVLSADIIDAKKTSEDLLDACLGMVPSYVIAAVEMDNRRRDQASLRV